MELVEEVYNKIEQLCNEGDAHVQICEFDKAIKKYEQALDLFPEDIEEYDESTMIYVAMGDAMFLAGEYKEAKKYFYDALNCPGALGNPYVMFRLGQCLYECNEESKAQNYFIKTYMLDGMNLFNTSDNKYFYTIKQMVIK